MLQNLNSPLSNSEQNAQSRKLMSDYFAALAHASAAAPPPGPNAANGWFRKAVYEDLKMGPYADVHFPSADTEAVHGAFAKLASGIHSAFAPDNYCSSVWTNGDLFIQALNNFKGQIANVVIAIFGSSSDDPQKKDQKKQDLGKAIGDLISAISGSKVQYHGCHMNGWISGGVHGVGVAMAPVVAGLTITDPEADEARKILKDVCDRLAAISLRNFSPWLDAQWQVEFQTVAAAAAAAFSFTPTIAVGAKPAAAGASAGAPATGIPEPAV
jgi:hypothetical protein